MVGPDPQNHQNRRQTEKTDTRTGQVTRRREGPWCSLHTPGASVQQQVGAQADNTELPRRTGSPTPPQRPDHGIHRIPVEFLLKC